MGYVERIINRADIQHIKEFLLYGVEAVERREEEIEKYMQIQYEEFCIEIKEK